MSKTTKAKGIYEVKRNWCNCHPETCCCNDWVLKDPTGKKVTTFFNREDAITLANKLNKGIGV